MKRDAIQRLIDALEADELRDERDAKIRFNMGTWFGMTNEGGDHVQGEEHECGTAACLAGWTVILHKGIDRTTRSLKIGPYDFIEDVAASILGLDSVTAARLFVPSVAGWPLHRIKRKHGIRVLKRLLETGKVDWHWALNAE